MFRSLKQNSAIIELIFTFLPLSILLILVKGTSLPSVIEVTDITRILIPITFAVYSLYLPQVAEKVRSTHLELSKRRRANPDEDFIEAKEYLKVHSRQSRILLRSFLLTVILVFSPQLYMSSRDLKKLLGGEELFQFITAFYFSISAILISNISILIFYLTWSYYQGARAIDHRIHWFWSSPLAISSLIGILLGIALMIYNWSGLGSIGFLISILFCILLVFFIHGKGTIFR